MSFFAAVLYFICVGLNGYMWATIGSALYAAATIIWAAGAGIWFALALNDLQVVQRPMELVHL